MVANLFHTGWKKFKKLNLVYQIIFIFGLLFFLFYSIKEGMNKGIQSDFYVFWRAGRDLLSGKQLYIHQQGLQFSYPPFAAILFAPLALFPLQTAGVIFSIINLILWILCIILTVEILEKYSNIRIHNLFIIIALLFSLNAYISNLKLLQVNNILFIFVLIGLYNYLKKNYILAGLWLACSICFKITPIVFLGWFFLRGKKKTFYSSLIFIGILTLIPILLRGPETGINDLKLFLNTIGNRIPTFSESSEKFIFSKSLMGLCNNYLAQIDGINYKIKKIIMRIIPILFGFSYVGWLIYLKIKDYSFTIYEWSGTFVIISLTSAVTFTAHLVTLIFPFLTLLISDKFIKRNYAKNITYILGSTFFLGGLSLTIKDLIGDYFYKLLIYRINIRTLSMIGIYILIVHLSIVFHTQNHQNLDTSEYIAIP